MVVNPSSDTASPEGSSLPWIRGALWARRCAVIGSFIALSITPFALIAQTTGLFVGPITHEFGWSRTEFFLAPSLAGAASGFMLIFLGFLGDRAGIRPVLLIGAVAYGLSVMAMSLLDGSIPLYLAVYTAVFVSGVTQTGLLYAKGISGWFAERRGLMISVAISGVGVGSILSPLVASALIERVGWRGAYVGLGILVIVIALPSIFFLVQESPRKERSDPAGPVVVTEGLTLPEAMRTRVYWTLLLLFGISNGALLSLVNNLVPALTSHGIALSTAAAAVSALGASQTLTRLLSGYVLDRTSFARVATVWYLLATGGAVLLYFAHSSSAGIATGLLIGTAWGAENELAAYFTSRYFGLRSYGLILGTFYSTFGIVSLPMVLLTARLFDMFGTYDLALIMLVGCLALSCVFALSLGPYMFSKTGIRHTRESATSS